MKLATTALACLLAAASLAGQDSDREERRKERWVAYGFRVSAAVPQSKIDRDAYGSGAFGVGFLAEWMVARQVAVSPSAEYLFFPTLEEYQPDRTPTNQEVLILVGKRKGNIIKVGADLVFRPDGLWRGPFYFIGGGIKMMNFTRNVAAGGISTEHEQKDEFGIAYFTFGAGYDFSRYFGTEIRYNNMPRSYKYTRIVNSTELPPAYEKDEMHNIQVSVRLRF